MHVELDLRPVEGTFARLRDGVEPGRARSRLERRLGPVPERVVAGAQGRPRRKPHLDRVEAEIGIDLPLQPAEIADLGLDLVVHAEDMGIVLRELPGTQETMQGAGRLVAMHDAELAIAHRQVAEGARPLIEDLDMAGAAHRLHRPGAAVLLDEAEHRVRRLRQMAAALEQRLRQQLRETERVLAQSR